MVDIGKAIEFPTKDKEWLTKIVVGGILSIIPVINFIAAGYELKVMRNAINKKPAMPRWENFGGLFVDGLVVFIISLIYMIVPIIVFVATSAVWGLPLFSIGRFMGCPFALVATFLPLIAITLVFAIIIGFILPMAIALYASSKNVGKAFKFGEILNRIKSVFGEYIVAYVFILILGIIIGAIAMIPYIGWIIALFVTFYIGVVSSNLFGELYAKSKA